jgi:hypothetical protein
MTTKVETAVHALLDGGRAPTLVYQPIVDLEREQ